jgi:hypothetical protein
VGRRIREQIDGSQPSSSPTRGRASGGEPRGSAALPAFPQARARCAATLAWMRKRLVPSARRGEASIGGDDLRVLAAFLFELELLRRGGVELGGREEARMGGERVGVKEMCSGLLYL